MDDQGLGLHIEFRDGVMACGLEGDQGHRPALPLKLADDAALQVDDDLHVLAVDQVNDAGAGQQQIDLELRYQHAFNRAVLIHQALLSSNSLISSINSFSW